MHLKAVAKEISLCWDTPDMYLPASMADLPHSSWCWLPVYWRRAGTKPSTVNVLTRLWQLLVILARPKGGLFRYHVKRNRFTMQGFGFLSAILVRQNWKRATNTDGEVPPSFNLARFELKKYCCLKLFTNKSVIISAIRFAVFINCISNEITI